MANLSRSSSSSSTSSGYYFDPSMSSNMNFTIPDDPSPNLRAFLRYIDALHRWDFDDIMACFDDTLEHRILPQSLGRPVLNKKQYGEYFRGVHPIFKAWRVSSKGESVNGTPYSQEYALIIHFAPQVDANILPKMTLVKEFVDSAFSIKFFSEERAKMEKLKAEGKKP
ncbi:hypothetical protein CVT24_010915 [Panaeolus cyanescens]|uniref:SnoaL-like domain-containing protein n=1 Tax=Panaeolus cyanescens TaxID=181874 RepID=A0A409YVP7_9AGAR|nr:hypothetical protein CVT24_010915 [Panaeolus cyanescens]